ncbi:methyltransferase [Cerasicoccus fimbriatus]|uniref:methyltransferase n=1 Tax=Cerasicoccus fimbriatus TaxID=3014554 RepID=UPI0022B4BEFC|nr:methyltransferase [Cerasicoccus sp. TK19100]
MPYSAEHLAAPAVSDQPIYDLIYHCLALPTLAVASELGLFTTLSKQPMTIASTAKALSLTERAAEAMISVGAASGFLQRGADGCFSLTEMACTYLLPDSPYSYGEVLGYGSVVNTGSYALESIRTAIVDGSKPADAKVIAASDLDAAELKPLFKLLHAHTLPTGAALAEHRYLAEAQRLLDVGAGSCSITCAIASKLPKLAVTAFDVPVVCELARDTLAQFGLEDRVKLMIGDMFRELPTGFDAHLFSNIFHDWDWDSCLQLAQQSFAALPPGGRILISEVPINENRDGPLFAACYTVAMLIREKGKQYAISEFAAMLETAGFINFESQPLFGYYHLITAQKPD